MLTLLALVLSTEARADARVTARRYFRSGMALIQKKQFEEGIAELQKAYETKPHPNVLFNIARAYQDWGKTDDAIKGNKDALQKTLTALFQAVQFIREKPGEAAAIATKTLQWPEEAIARADIVYLGMGDLARHLLPVVLKHGRTVWTDLHDYDGMDPAKEAFIDAAAVVLFSADRLKDPRPTMRRLRDRGKALVVGTLAERGAVALSADGRWTEVAAEPADVVERESQQKPKKKV